MWIYPVNWKVSTIKLLLNQPELKIPQYLKQCIYVISESLIMGTTLFFAMLHSLWGLGSLIRDQTRSLCSESVES